jgi:hypothetical protein
MIHPTRFKLSGERWRCCSLLHLQKNDRSMWNSVGDMEVKNNESVLTMNVMSFQRQMQMEPMPDV